MSEVIDKFLAIKEDVLIESLRLIEQIHDMENLPNFDTPELYKRLISIQSKISSLSSLASTNERQIKKLQQQVEKIIDQSVKAELEKDNPIQHVFELGKLASITMSYLNAINSIQFNLNKKRFTINLDTLKFDI